MGNEYWYKGGRHIHAIRTHRDECLVLPNGLSTSQLVLRLRQNPDLGIRAPSYVGASQHRVETAVSLATMSLTILV